MKREDLIIYTADITQSPYGESEVYTKDEADAVMDAYEARIKELEEQCTKYQAELMNNDPALNCVPKWISVKDRLPEEYNEMLVYDCDGSIYVAELIDNGDCKRWMTSFFVTTIENTHWLPLPPPPTTEESSTIEKEK